MAVPDDPFTPLSPLILPRDMVLATVVEVAVLEATVVDSRFGVLVPLVGLFILPFRLGPFAPVTEELLLEVKYEVL